MRSFTVGTRGSALALWQTRHVTALLGDRGLTVHERIITTQGDTSQAERLVGKLEKGFFTQELESALHVREIDWAVHSLKDLPTRMPAGLVLGAVLTRAAPGDLLLMRPDAVDEGRLLPVKPGATLGSSSLRRESMVRHFAPDASPRPLRGNVPTRVDKLRAGLYDGILLAEAGVRRLSLNLDGLAVFQLNPHRWPCAPGQGAVAVQCREDDAEVRAHLATLTHQPTAFAVNLERDFLRVLEGGCTTPFGCFIENGRAWMGQATEAGWLSRSVSLPAEPTTPWLEQQLSSFNTLPEENNNEWLARRV